MKTPFSVRHKKIIESKSWEVVFSTSERARLISFLYRYNYLFDNVTETNWHFTTSSFEMVFSDLKQIYGYPIIKSFEDEESKEDKNLEEFLNRTQPPNVLDSVELIYGYIIDDKSKNQFVKELNELLKLWEKPLRFSDGEFFRLDSEFLKSEIIFRTVNLLKESAFEKANSDFLDAQRRLSSGDFDGCIIYANNALESLLMKMTNTENISQGSLKKSLLKSGIIPDYYGGFLEHFDKLLQSVFTIANKASRHGKKDFPDERNMVTEPVANFCLNIVGTFISFIVERYLELNPESLSIPEVNGNQSDEDLLPF